MDTNPSQPDHLGHSVPLSTSLPETSTKDLLDALARVREEEQYRELLRHGLVDELRRRRMPWHIIAETLNINERTLRRKYSRPFYPHAYITSDHD